jgi:hypothetical protein
VKFQKLGKNLAQSIKPEPNLSTKKAGEEEEYSVLCTPWRVFVLSVSDLLIHYRQIAVAKEEKLADQVLLKGK